MDGWKVKTEKEIDKVLEKLYSLVDTGDQEASMIYDTLQWVIGNDDEDPYQKYIEDVG
jgi:hypothetical protein